MSTRLIQLQKGRERRLACVEEPRLRLCKTIHTAADLVHTALGANLPLADVIHEALSDEHLDYDPIYAGESDWKILPPFDHPDAAHCHVAGTGLTHLGSAKNRNAMHVTEKSEVGSQKSEGRSQKSEGKIDNPETDSMKMFRWGLEGGRPAAGHVGIAPEWFYKGDGAVLRAHNQPLDVPSFGEDGGEEAEIVGIYLIDSHGTPVRVGMAQGNEFSDHVFEKKNYLNLAGSKLRTCSIGPELVMDPDFATVPGDVAILRAGTTIWSKSIATGEAEMSHSLANLEHHHFKFDAHRRPGDVHIHFFGTSALSYGAGVKLQDGDIMQIQFQAFGRALRNPLRVAAPSSLPIVVKPLT